MVLIYIQKNIAHLIFFLIASLSCHNCFCLGIASRNVHYLTIQLLNIYIYIYIRSASGVDKMIFPVVVDGHMHYSNKEPFGNVFNAFYGRSRPGDQL